MGQRSQIYVQAHKANSQENEPSEKLFANYYQWNYGEYMLSRLRGFGDWYNTHKERLHSYEVLDQIPQCLDYCPDSNDFRRHLDIIEEAKELDGDTYEEQIQGIFNGQDNNDGQLFIKVSGDDLAYAFAEQGSNKVMDANQYMNWDVAEGKDWKSYFKASEYYDDKDIEVTQANIDAVQKNFRLMTPKELKAFKEHDYSRQLADYRTTRLELVDANAKLEALEAPENQVQIMKEALKKIDYSQLSEEQRTDLQQILSPAAFREMIYQNFEKEGHSDVFYSDSPDYENLVGKPYQMLGRTPANESETFLDGAPMWDIQFEDGKQISAFCDEIIPSVILENHYELREDDVPSVPFTQEESKDAPRVMRRSKAKHHAVGKGSR